MIILIFESFKCEGDLLSQSALRLGSLQRLPDWAGPVMAHGVMQTPARPHSADRASRLTVKNMALNLIQNINKDLTPSHCLLLILTLMPAMLGQW